MSCAIDQSDFCAVVGAGPRSERMIDHLSDLKCWNSMFCVDRQQLVELCEPGRRFDICLIVGDDECSPLEIREHIATMTAFSQVMVCGAICLGSSQGLATRLRGRFDFVVYPEAIVESDAKTAIEDLLRAVVMPGLLSTDFVDIKEALAAGLYSVAMIEDESKDSGSIAAVQRCWDRLEQWRGHLDSISGALMLAATGRKAVGPGDFPSVLYKDERLPEEVCQVAKICFPELSVNDDRVTIFASLSDQGGSDIGQ